MSRRPCITNTRLSRFRPAAWLSLLLSLALPAAFAQAQAEDNWLNVVRQTPYWESQGVADNLATVRRWVLFGESYCSESRRHLLFDRRGRFLGYIDDADNTAATIDRLNEARREMVADGRVDVWSPGALEDTGYPFALACNQPFVDIGEAVSRLTGDDEQYRLWGTWDGMTAGSPDNQVSLVQLFRTVYTYRRDQGLFSFPDAMLPALLGKIIIESGARQGALSAANARGIMQLNPQVLDDCRIPDEFRLHRMAQVDCALRLMEQNHRNLTDPFNDVFGHLPGAKRETLYELLLTQTYLIGVGRATELLDDEELGEAARYFAANHERFSARDIVVGLAYHNLGRRDIGLRTLYYVTDTRLARQALCEAPAMTEDPWCSGG